jgi:hypothetical protein
MIDARDYARLLDEALERIQVYAPEWTDVNRSDIGPVLVELFAFLAEALVAYLEDDRRRRRRRRALVLSGISGAAFVLWWKARCGSS